MARMSLTRKQELGYFLKDGRIAYHDKCRKCKHACKQSYKCDITYCAKYEPKRKKHTQNE